MTDLKQGCVLFDLDGTLVDTARDLVAPANVLRQRQGLQPLPFSSLRNWVSHGAAMVLRKSFPDASDEALSDLLPEFLSLYAKDLCVHSQLFDGLQGVLDQLDGAGVPWGIVTNKPAFLTDPLIAALDIQPAPSCVVSGDTLEVKKPDPAPVIHACRMINADPLHSVYVGDAQRDVEAGLRAGCHAIAVTWGYIQADENPGAWDAHELIDDPTVLARSLGRMTNLDR